MGKRNESCNVISIVYITPKVRESEDVDLVMYYETNEISQDFELDS
jgi:hypothetical protein